MFDAAINSFKRRLARGTLGFLLSAHFMRRRALAILSRHYTKGQLTLRYHMKDHTLYLDPSDDVITPRVLWRGNWQRRDLERVIEMLKIKAPSARGRHFIDVGANIGSETIYAMLSGFFSGAVAIEPDPRNFSLLNENITANDLEARVRPVNCAAGLRAETGKLIRSTWNRGGHSLEEKGHAALGVEAITVNVKPLSAILQEAGISAKEVGLVWIDVNGTEASVLKGMSEILERRVPVVVEHLPSLIDAETAREVHRLLSQHYKSYWRIDDENTRSPAPVSEMDPLREAGDFMFF